MRKRRAMTNTPASQRVMAKMMMEMPTQPVFKVFLPKQDREEPGKAWTHLCSALEGGWEGWQALLLPALLMLQVLLAYKHLQHWGLGRLAYKHLQHWGLGRLAYKRL
jgi:hypothetical protein